MINEDKLIAVVFSAMKYAIEHDVDECSQLYKYTLTLNKKKKREP